MGLGIKVIGMGSLPLSYGFTASLNGIKARLRHTKAGQGGTEKQPT